MTIVRVEALAFVDPLRCSAASVGLKFEPNKSRDPDQREHDENGA